MREETERQFRQLLEQHDREFLKRASSRAERALGEQEFDRAFHERCKTVIHPVMARLHALMHDHNLQSGVVVAERHVAPDGRIIPSSIAFEFRVLTDPETHGFPVVTPALSFIADPTIDTVLVHENSILPFLGGHVGVIDRAPIDGITGEMVERHLLALAQKVLRGTGAS